MDAVVVLAKILGVFALLGLTLLVLKRTNGGAPTRTRTKAIEVRGTARLGKSASVTVLRVNGEELLVGVTEQSVTLLSRHAHDGEAAEPVAEQAPGSQPVARTVPELVDLVLTSRSEVPAEAIASALLATRQATDGTAATITDSTDAPERPESSWNRLVRMTRQPLASRGAGR